MVTTYNEEIKIWELDDYEKYEPKLSIPISETERQAIIALSENGNCLAFFDNSERLYI